MLQLVVQQICLWLWVPAAVLQKCLDQFHSLIAFICLLGYYYYENKLLRVVFCNEKHFIKVFE